MSDSFVTPWTVAHQVHEVPWDFSGKNAGVGCHFLLQSIFPTHGSNVPPALQADFLFFTPELPGKI